jgi:hypothetical protein
MITIYVFILVYPFLFVKFFNIITQHLNYLGCPNPYGAHIYPIFHCMLFERVGGLFVNVGWGVHKP